MESSFCTTGSESSSPGTALSFGGDEGISAAPLGGDERLANQECAGHVETQSGAGMPMEMAGNDPRLSHSGDWRFRCADARASDSLRRKGLLYVDSSSNSYITL